MRMCGNIRIFVILDILLYKLSDAIAVKQILL